MAEHQAMAQYLALAKTARPRSVVQIIADATGHPLIFGFGELLDEKNVAALAGSEWEPHLRLLEIFCYGKLADYRAAAPGDALPELSAAQELKLKQLSVISLAMEAPEREVSYDALMEQLGAADVRELEDLLINECIYKGIVKGKLDQKRRTFGISDAIGRDVRRGQLDHIASALGQWSEQAGALLTSIEEKIRWANVAEEKEAKRRERLDEQAQALCKTIKSDDLQAHQDGLFMDRMGMDFGQEEGTGPGPKPRRTKRRFGN